MEPSNPKGWFRQGMSRALGIRTGRTGRIGQFEGPVGPAQLHQPPLMNRWRVEGGLARFRYTVNLPLKQLEQWQNEAMATYPGESWPGLQKELPKGVAPSTIWGGGNPWNSIHDSLNGSPFSHRLEQQVPSSSFLRHDFGVRERLLRPKGGEDVSGAEATTP